MDLGLAGRSVLVTGGASGIGAACVRVLCDEGARVTVLDRDPRGAGAAGAEAFVRADVAVEADVRSALRTVAARGPLDAVVCCAGISGPVGTPAHQVDVEAWDAVMAVNARGPFLVAKHAQPLLAARPGAAIVFVASDSALVAAPGMAPYCASKGALLMLARALSVDLAPDGIRVNCVCPSIVDTPMSRGDLALPDGFAGQDFPVIDASEVARHVAYLASPLSAAVNGAALVADHGFLARSGFPA
ncbi:SDR family NAD(P)-dependent oxidoreductase [Conexibacter woesei]|uniref:SDR family NAD(P)-dependent oxidoreductase n=1 Tax=Conexibacter woesei TaxID=191495 RepID=UPI000413022C|nr:SDR family oxidoreductase [Conexibacter woesei]